MTAVRQQIFDEIERRHRAIVGAEEVETMPTGDPADFPALHIFDGGQRPAEQETGATRYALAVTIEGYVDACAESGAFAQLNDLYAASVATMMTEPPLGGLAETIEEGELRVDNAALASTERHAFAQDFTITFATKRGAPSQPA